MRTFVIQNEDSSAEGLKSATNQMKHQTVWNFDLVNKMQKINKNGGVLFLVWSSITLNCCACLSNKLNVTMKTNIVLNVMRVLIYSSFFKYKLLHNAVEYNY